MATSPEALAAALGPDRTLVPEAAALSGNQRFVLWLTASRVPLGFELFECANGHPTIAVADNHTGRVRCDRGCGGLVRVAAVRRREETTDGCA